MNEHVVIFVGTYTRGRSGGIYSLRMDLGSGKLSEARLAARAENPSFLAGARSGKFLYAVSEANSRKRRRIGTVSTYSVAENGMALKLLNTQSSRGEGPCHVSLDASGRVAFVANYAGGSACVLPVGPDGLLGEGREAIVHSAPASGRRAHVHSLNVDPSGRFVLAADLGLDKVFVYRLDVDHTLLRPAEPPALELATGAGPRHLAFHPFGHVVYVINELNSTLTVCTWDAARGRLEDIQAVSTLPDGFVGCNATAEVSVHPSGRFVYGANRGHDSIAAFAVDPGSGCVTPAGYFTSVGRTPRHFAIVPGGEFLVAANQDSNNVVVFKIDQQSGVLTPTGAPVEIPSPVCVLPAQPVKDDGHRTAGRPGAPYLTGRRWRLIRFRRRSYFPLQTSVDSPGSTHIGGMSSAKSVGTRLRLMPDVFSADP